MTINEAAAILGLSPVHVRRLCRTGAILATRPGGQWLPVEESVHAYLAAERRPALSTHPRAKYQRLYQRRRRAK